jgi:CHAT domain-containing protein/tetratricopeptide (TPR) repeat protein
MRERAGARKAKEKCVRTLLRSVCTAWALWLSACSSGFEGEPLVEYSTELLVADARSPTVTRQLDAGTYLLEVRERDIDLRVSIDAAELHQVLADGLPRHGVHRSVVSLGAPARLRITLASIDQRSWKGAAALRILRWPRSAPDAGPDQRLLGFSALGDANRLIAKDSVESWRASLAPLREAERHFQVARDSQSAAEADYQRGFVEFELLYDFDASRRSAEAAIAHFRIAGDEVGAQRAAMLLGFAEFSIASRMGPEVPRGQQRVVLNTAARRLEMAQEFFESRDMESDALMALGMAGMRAAILGRGDDNDAAYESLRARAYARGDRYFEAAATRGLAAIALRKGDAARAAALCEGVLPLIERDRNPALYAAIRADLGSALTSLGEFDRAQALHSEALELFAARGDDTHAAREFAALAALQLRSGNVERALGMLEQALPLYERAGDHEGYVSAMRLAGAAASGLGRHDDAIGYLRKAEFHDRNGVTIDRTHVLIAGELRALGDLRGAEELLAQAMLTHDAATRADALSERAQLRMRQHRHREALTDLREADAAYARLKLDFNRIESSAALSLALLDAGDIPGASAAADVAVAMERHIRDKAADPETRARFLSASYTPYEARIEADIASWPADRGALWRAFIAAEAVRARSLSDRVEARLSRRDGASPAGQFVIGQSRAAVQSALPADTAVLAFFVGERRSHAWLLTRRDLRHTTLPGRRVLEDLVASAISRQRSSTHGANDPPLPPLLGNLLDGAGATRLLILPDGPLNSLPFAALPAPQLTGRELLIDRFTIAAAPSLTVALRAAPRHVSGATLVAVVADPVYRPDDRRLTAAALHASRFRGAAETSASLARLPYSAIEARAVARAFRDADIIELTGFEATARRVIELPSQQLSVLHFATHAVSRRDAPEQSALFLSEYAADGSPLPSDRLTAGDIARSGLRADIVVLSGCATGDGRELRGEGVLGLTYGFLANGSDTVVASLWPVEDALTARFMEEFYAAYRSTGRAADALRAAQLRARGQRGPTVWSSFVVRSNGLP